MSEKKMSIFNHWRRESKILVFAPRVVSDLKLEQQKKHMVNASGSSSSCASCGSGCSGGGCSGIGCGTG